MQLAESEAHGNVMLKLHLYRRQTMAVTEFENGVGAKLSSSFSMRNRMKTFINFRKIN